MSTRSVPFAPGEWFHCFNRGVDKRKIFMDEWDAERFLILLYVCNGTKKIHPSDFSMRQGKALTLLQAERGRPLVDIGAYCLMPNHLHILMRETDYGGISSFMQKLGTAYTMYFNKRYERTGSLFSGKFISKHVDDDAYFRRLFNYIHAHPTELFEPRWKEGVVKNPQKLKAQLCAYRFSSLPDFMDFKRAENSITSTRAALKQLPRVPSFATILADARAFYNYETGIGEDLG